MYSLNFGLRVFLQSVHRVWVKNKKCLVVEQLGLGGFQTILKYASIKSLKYTGCLFFGVCVNDPSAGSPTETLLRLLLPRNVQI